MGKIPKNICVFASSSDAVEGCFVDAAKALGKMLGHLGVTLVYGGASVGLMKHLALTAQENGSKVIGIIPKKIRDYGVAYEAADELIVTKNMEERKTKMSAMSDAFIALPGGLGTLDEVSDVLTLKQLQFHDKPIVLLNTDNFFDPLAAFLEKMIQSNFAKPVCRELYYMASDVSGVFAYLESYQPVSLGTKWF